MKVPKSANALSLRARGSPMVENTAATAGWAVALDRETWSATSDVSCALFMVLALRCASLAV